MAIAGVDLTWTPRYEVERPPLSADARIVIGGLVSAAALGGAWAWWAWPVRLTPEEAEALRARGLVAQGPEDAPPGMGWAETTLGNDAARTLLGATRWFRLKEVGYRVWVWQGGKNTSPERLAAGPASTETPGASTMTPMPDAAPPAPDASDTILGLTPAEFYGGLAVALASGAISAYHGGKRHASAVGALAWGLFGALLPPVAIPAALWQGYAVPSNRVRLMRIEGSLAEVERELKGKGVLPFDFIAIGDATA